jgi:heme/copper-type cytochrome/quinol oxidase subunit 2
MTRIARRLGVVVAGVATWAASGTVALACPVCFQIEDGAVANGVRAAILVLMGITIGVLAGFAAFIRRFVRRAAADAEE